MVKERGANSALTYSDIAEDCEQQRRAWGDWLRCYQWSHVVTLTTRHPTTATQLRKQFHNAFIRRLGRLARRSVQWFFAIESGPLGDQPHVHALISGTSELTVAQIAGAWKEGITRVNAYDARRGAAFYVSKELSRIPDDYDMSRRFPRRFANDSAVEVGQAPPSQRDSSLNATSSRAGAGFPRIQQNAAREDASNAAAA